MVLFYICRHDSFRHIGIIRSCMIVEWEVHSFSSVTFSSTEAGSGELYGLFTDQDYCVYIHSIFNYLCVNSFCDFTTLHIIVHHNFDNSHFLKSKWYKLGNIRYRRRDKPLLWESFAVKNLLAIILFSCKKRRCAVCMHISGCRIFVLYTNSIMHIIKD